MCLNKRIYLITIKIYFLILILINAIKTVLEQTPPELASDIIDRGIVISGGSSQLKGIDRYIAGQIGVSAHLTEDPMHAVVYGAGVAVENIESWKRFIQVR